MHSYLIVKWIHIVSSVLLVGTGFGSAFYLFFANRSGDVRAMAVVGRLVVRADTWFTTPTGFVQPISGFAMMHMAGWPWTTPWLLASFALYLLAGACWLPVVWLQWQMTKMARAAVDNNEALPDLYWHFARWWEALGYPAFIAMLIVFYLMVNKPALW